jgi:hypothetical protein
MEIKQSHIAPDMREFGENILGAGGSGDGHSQSVEPGPQQILQFLIIIDDE